MNDNAYIEHTPMSEDEVLGMLPEGEYPALIKNITVRTGRKDPSKKYFVAEVEVDHKDKTFILQTWLALPFLLKHLYDSTGNGEKYKEKKLYAKDCIGCKTVVRIKKQAATDKFPARHVVADFLTKPTENTELELNDDIPF